jgi:hypothetical protein
VNLFRYNRQTGIYAQVSNYNSSIRDFDLNFGSQTLALVATQDMGEDIFKVSNFNIERQIFTPASRRREVQQAKTLTEKRKQEQPKNMSIKDLINARLKEKTDTTKQEPKPEVKPDSVKSEKGVINTDDYTFEESSR